MFLKSVDIVWFVCDYDNSHVCIPVCRTLYLQRAFLVMVTYQFCSWNSTKVSIHRTRGWRIAKCVLGTAAKHTRPLTFEKKSSLEPPTSYHWSSGIS